VLGYSFLVSERLHAILLSLFCVPSGLKFNVYNPSDESSLLNSPYRSLLFESSPFNRLIGIDLTTPTPPYAP